MSDDSETPVKDRKSLLRRIFSQAEPAPSKRQDPPEPVRPVAPAPVAKPEPAKPEPIEAPVAAETAVEQLARDIPTIAPKPDPSPEADIPEVDIRQDDIRQDDIRQDDIRQDDIRQDDIPEPAPAPAEPLPVAPAVDLSPTPSALAEPAPKRSWWGRLREGLARSSSSIGTGIGDIFTKRKLDAAMLEDLEDVLVRADLGVATATRICDAVGKGRYDKTIAPDEVKAILAGEVERVLAPYARPIAIEAKTPFVILVVGVNGSGKTTTIGKLTAKFTGEGKRVMLAAGDTFRAAAIAQLKIWGERLGADVVAREQGSDAASLAYEAIEEARAKGANILLMDTAGRLQNRAELMAELEKIIRVMRKVEPGAPHAVLLVLDATVGQNAMSQVEIFGKVAGVTGLVMTKLDGTARGGILVAVTEKFKLPVHFIGVGETAEDLEPFEARDFAEAIAGIER